MKVVTTRQENTCSLCKRPIPVGSEAFMFFHTDRKPEFVHSDCQFRKYQRKISFQEYMDRRRKDEELRKFNKRIEETKKRYVSLPSWKELKESSDSQ